MLVKVTIATMCTFERLVSEISLANEVWFTPSTSDSVSSIVPDMRTRHFTVDSSLTSTTVVCAAQDTHEITSDNKVGANLFAIAVSPLKFTDYRHRKTDNLSESRRTASTVTRIESYDHKCEIGCEHVLSMVILPAPEIL